MASAPNTGAGRQAWGSRNHSHPYKQASTWSQLRAFAKTCIAVTVRQQLMPPTLILFNKMYFRGGWWPRVHRALLPWRTLCNWSASEPPELSRGTCNQKASWATAPAQQFPLLNSCLLAQGWAPRLLLRSCRSHKIPSKGRDVFYSFPLLCSSGFSLILHCHCCLPSYSSPLQTNLNFFVSSPIAPEFHLFTSPTPGSQRHADTDGHTQIQDRRPPFHVELKSGGFESFKHWSVLIWKAEHQNQHNCAIKLTDTQEVLTYAI